MSVQSVLSNAASRRVLIVGDSIEDVYYYGRVVGTSGEAQVPVFLVDQSVVSLGGAFLVHRNATALHAISEFVGPTPAHTYRKVRYVSPEGKLFRVDEPSKTSHELNAVSSVIPDLRYHDILIVSDYRHGFLSSDSVVSMLRAARHVGIPSFASWQARRDRVDVAQYFFADVIVMNQNEASQLPGVDWQCLKWTVITDGAGGCTALSRDGARFRVSGKPITAVDTTGAGDAFLAALAVSFSGFDKNSFEASLQFANLWAAAACLTQGPEPPSIKTLETLL